jgi:hypothetical protein
MAHKRRGGAAVVPAAPPVAEPPPPKPPGKEDEGTLPPAAEGETEALAAAAGAAPAAEGDAAGGDKTEKETETEDVIPASKVIEEEDKGANERWKTVKPPAGFEELTPFEKFVKAPDVVPPGGGDPVQLGRVLDKALLFGKSSKKSDDDISTIVTYDIVAPRPKVYTSPEPLEGFLWPMTGVRLNVRGYGSAGESREVVYALCIEADGDSLVNAVCYDLGDAQVAEHLLWRVVGAGPVDVTDDQKKDAGLAVMQFMSEKSRGQPSASAARAARKETKDKKEEAKKKSQDELADRQREERESAKRDRELEKERQKLERERIALEKDKIALSKKSGKRRGKEENDDDEEDEEEEVQLQLTKKEAAAAFPSATSIGKRKSRETPKEHTERLHAACRAYGRKKPESFTKGDNTSYLTVKLGYDVEPEGPPPKGDGKPGGKADEPDPAEASGKPADARGKWERLPSSSYDGFFYWLNKETGEVQWEEQPAATKKVRPAGPPPGFGQGMALSGSSSSASGSSSGSSAISSTGVPQIPGLPPNFLDAASSSGAQFHLHNYQPGVNVYQYAAPNPAPEPALQLGAPAQRLAFSATPRQHGPSTMMPQQAGGLHGGQQHQQQQIEQHHQQQHQHGQPHVAGAPQHPFYQ